jgi:hypothetical protein
MRLATQPSKIDLAISFSTCASNFIAVIAKATAGKTTKIPWPGLVSPMTAMHIGMMAKRIKAKYPTFTATFDAPSKTLTVNMPADVNSKALGTALATPHNAARRKPSPKKSHKSRKSKAKTGNKPKRPIPPAFLAYIKRKQAAAKAKKKDTAMSIDTASPLTHEGHKKLQINSWRRKNPNNDSKHPANMVKNGNFNVYPGDKIHYKRPYGEHHAVVGVERKHAAQIHSKGRIPEERPAGHQDDYIIHNNAERQLWRKTQPVKTDSASLDIALAGLSEPARKLVMHADNDEALHRQSHVPIVANLAKKAKKGVYDPEKARKLWGYHAERAAQSLHKKDKMSGTWHQHFSTAARKEAAAHFEKANRPDGVKEDKAADIDDTFERHVSHTDKPFRVAHTTQRIDLKNGGPAPLKKEFFEVHKGDRFSAHSHEKRPGYTRVLHHRDVMGKSKNVGIYDVKTPTWEKVKTRLTKRGKLDTAKTFSANKYNWRKYQGDRGKNLVFKRGKGAGTKHRLEPGDVFGLRPATSDKGKHRLVLKKHGTGKVFSIPNSHADSLMKNSRSIVNTKSGERKLAGKPAQKSSDSYVHKGKALKVAHMVRLTSGPIKSHFHVEDGDKLRFSHKINANGKHSHFTYHTKKSENHSIVHTHRISQAVARKLKNLNSARTPRTAKKVVKASLADSADCHRPDIAREMSEQSGEFTHHGPRALSVATKQLLPNGKVGKKFVRVEKGDRIRLFQGQSQRHSHTMVHSKASEGHKHIREHGVYNGVARKLKERLSRHSDKASAGWCGVNHNKKSIHLSRWEPDRNGKLQKSGSAGIVYPKSVVTQGEAVGSNHTNIHVKHNMFRNDSGGNSHIIHNSALRQLKQRLTPVNSDKASDGMGRFTYHADKPTTLKSGGNGKSANSRPQVSKVMKGDHLTIHPDRISPKHVNIYHNKPAPNDPDLAARKFGRNVAVHRITKEKAALLQPKITPAT